MISGSTRPIPAALASLGVTGRELVVLLAVGRRHANGEIADELGISKRTVESHVSSLLSKLGVHDRAALVRIGLEAAEAFEERPSPDLRPPPQPPRPPMVGREAELAVLRAHLREAVAGRGGVTTVAGEPGIGKTRLLEELASEAQRQGARCLVGHALEAEGSPPFAPVLEILDAALGSVGPDAFRAALGEDAAEVARLLPTLRDRFPDVGPAPEVPPQQERRLLFAAIRATIGRLTAQAPLVLAFEDVHWADPATLLLLEHLAERAGRLPLLIVATHRDAESDVWPDLGATLARLVQLHRVRRMQLHPLDEAAVGHLITARTGRPAPAALRRAIHERTEGNPFFADELITFLAQEGLLRDGDGELRELDGLGRLGVPDTLRLVVGHRLDRLTPGTRAVLQVAALIGRTFDIDLLERAVEDPAGRPVAGRTTVLDALDEAIGAGLLLAASDGGDRAVFTHALVREILMDQLSPPRRRRMHLRLAQVRISAAGGDADAYAAQIAFHLIEADTAADPEAVLRFCLTAGRQFLARSAIESALGVLEHAEGLAGVASLHRQGELEEALAVARFAAGRIDDAIASWSRSLDAFERCGDAGAAGRVCVTLGIRLTYSARLADAERLIERGLALLGEEAGADRALLLSRLGLIRAFAGDPVHGDALLEQALREVDGVEEVHGVPARSLILNDVAVADHGSFRIAAAADAGRRGAELALQAGNLWTAADCLWSEAWDLSCVGRLEDAAQVGASLDPLADRLQEPGVLACAQRARGVRAFLAGGDLDAYAEFARRDAEYLEAQLDGAWIGTAYCFQAHAEFLRGDWAAADALVARGPVNCGPALAGFCTGLALLLHAYSSRRATALALLKEHRDELPAPGVANNGGSWALALAAVESLALLGEHEAAAALYPTVLEASTVSGAKTSNYAPLQLLERLCAIAAAAGGRWDDAEAHFRSAVEDADRLPYVVERYETRRFFARMLTARDGAGDREEAQRLSDEAARGYRSLGMHRHVALARAAVPQER